MTEELPRPPAHIERYVELLGVDEAIRFFLTFGGAELYIARKPTKRSKLVREMGEETARSIAANADYFPRRVPIPKPWIAGVWRARDLTISEIATRLHVSDKTVYEMLKRPFEGGGLDEDERQGRLF
ncbi:helix-turn-helix domain-containing protein [Pseudoroseicyclus sp. H15]